MKNKSDIIDSRDTASFEFIMTKAMPYDGSRLPQYFK